jgi:acetolactate synthase-1/2/3 large subunit
MTAAPVLECGPLGGTSLAKGVAPQRRGGRILVDALIEQGAGAVFCVPGESYLSALDALYDAQQSIRLITCRHESGAAFMAEAYGKLTGRPGVCFVSRAPGACNASIGIVTAYQDSTPMVVLAGQVAREECGCDYPQELPVATAFGGMLKHAEQVDDPRRIPEAVARAFHLAISGRPGPVLLAFPEDVLSESCAVENARAAVAPRSAPPASALTVLRERLAQAKRPLVLAGFGLWNPSIPDAIATFAERNNIAVVAAKRRQDVIDNGHPCYIGHIGNSAVPGLSERICEADLLISVGARLVELPTQPYSRASRASAGQMLVHVHPSANELGPIHSQESLVIAADPGKFYRALAVMPPVDSQAWRGWTQEARAAFEADVRPPKVPGPVNPAEIIRTMQSVLGNAAVVTMGAGNYTGWVHRFGLYGPRRRIIGPVSGAMGYGVPAAIGAQVAIPSCRPVSVSGDGCFWMTALELATARHHALNPICIVLNNGMYGTIRSHQELAFPDRSVGTDLTNPDFAAYAQCLGGFGATVRKTEEFEQALRAAVAATVPAVIDVRVDPEAITTRASLSEIRERGRAAALA